jgi:AcrR family transcriptional regulator
MARSTASAGPRAQPTGDGRDRDARTRRQEVLAVAARLFAERGYHGTSMRDIAEALSMRAPSLYKHVKNKDALLDEIVTIYLDALLPRLETTATGPGVGAERLAAMLATTIEVGRAHLDEFLTLSNDWNQIRRSPALVDVRVRTRRAIPLWLQVLRDGMRDGSLRSDLDTTRALRVLIGAASSMIDTRFDDLDDLDDIDVLDDSDGEATSGRAAVAIDTLLHGLRA